MLSEEREKELKALAEQTAKGYIVTDRQATGEPEQRWNLELEHTDEEGKKWRAENDYGGTLIERAVSSAGEIYRNMISGDEGTMSEAKRLGERVGISPQFLLDNPESLERVREINKESINWAYMRGQRFSAANLDSLYPELVEMRQRDPVGASIALKNYADMTATQVIFDNLKESKNKAVADWQTAVNAFNSGSDMVKLYDAQMRVYNGEDMESVRPEIDNISKRLQEYQEQDRPDTQIGKIVYDTIQQLTVMGNQALRASKRAAQGAVVGATASVALAAGIEGATLGAGTPVAIGTVLAGAAQGAALGFRVGYGEEVWKQSAASRYWELMNRKDAAGNQIYTRKNALIDSTATGALNAAIEVGLLHVATKPITAAWGKNTAKAILNSAAAQRAIVDAGESALMRMALVSGGKQWARGSAAELVEEGSQQIVNDLADNAESYINRNESEIHSPGEVLKNAIDAMVQAVPAVIGMGAVGVGPRMIGEYHTTKAVAGARLENWRQLYQRQVEQDAITRLIEDKKTNKLAQTNPEVYRNVIQAQAAKSGMEELYVDAQELARTDKGVAVLTDIVNKGMVTAEQVDTAIEKGTDIVIPTGVFTQLVDESMDTDTLMRATTMTQKGIHRAALEERAARLENMRKEIAELAANKKDTLTGEILKDHFADADPQVQEAAADIISRNPYDLEEGYKESVKEARKNYEDAINFNYYWNYQPEGVSIITADIDGHNNTGSGRGIRVSENEPWYSDMYKELGRKATKTEMLDVAYKNEYKELAATNPERLEEWDEAVHAAKEKYEAVEGLKNKIAELNKSDYALRKSLSKEGAEVYRKVAQTLEQGPKAVQSAAKENAYIYARMAETWAKIRQEYGDTLYTAKDFMTAHPVIMGQGTGDFSQTITPEEKLTRDEQAFTKTIDKFMNNELTEKVVDVMTTPLVMKLVGAEVLPIKISVFELNKILKNRHSDEMSPELLKRLPRALTDPLMILDTYNGKGGQKRKIIVVELTGKTGSNVIVPLELSTQIRQTGEIANLMISAYEPTYEPKKKGEQKKPRYKYFFDKIKEGKLAYVNKNKTRQWLKSETVYSAMPDESIADLIFESNIPNEENLVKLKEQYPGYYQRAWHGTPYDFNTFDLSGIGSGEGNQVHGWGLYFAKNREVSEGYKDTFGSKGSAVELNGDIWTVSESGDWETDGKTTKYGEAIGYALDALEEHGTKDAAINALQKELKEGKFRGTYVTEAQKAVDILQKGEGKGHKGGRLLEVEIPDEDVLLDEQKPFDEQPKKVRDALNKLIDNMDEEQLWDIDDVGTVGIQGARETAKRMFTNSTGQSIYGTLYDLYGGDKEASLKLNEFGIKGITYEGTQEGRCYVVFDDKAIEIRNKYEQDIKASYESATGAIRLFDAADQSSFIHEAAHMYLSEMGRMVQDENVPDRMLKDWNTIREWAAYKPEDMADYVGTAREKEFRTYIQEIEAARKSGDAVAIKAAEERWIQERFARGFERYIAEGKAPAEALKSPFRKFKEWLVSIYRDLKNLGKEPPEDVKRVMDRMLATDDEIENWAKIRELNAWDRKGFAGDLTGSEGEMIKEWNDKIKARVKEKLLAGIIQTQQDMWESQKESGLATERIDYEKQLTEENKIYKQELIYRAAQDDKKLNILKAYGYENAAEFEEALQKAGGTLEDRVNRYMEERRKAYEDMMPTAEDIRMAADAELTTTSGQARLAQLEAYAMRKKINGYIAEAVRAMRETDKLEGKSEEEVTKGLQQILNATSKEDAKKGQSVAKMLQKQNVKAELSSVKAALKEVMQGLNAARDATNGNYMRTLRAAQEELEQYTVADATTWRHWEIKGKSESHRADALMASGNFKDAVLAKNNSLKYYCMARAAKDNQEYVRKKLEGENGRMDDQHEPMDGVLGMIKRISRRKDPVQLNANSRYFIQRLAYVTGLRIQDGIKPLGEDGMPGDINWESIYRDLSPDYAMDESTGPRPDDIVAPWLRALVMSSEKQDYKNMPMTQFKDMITAMNVIYKVSRREYEATTLTDSNGAQVGMEEAARRLIDTIEPVKDFNAMQEQNDKTSAGRAKEWASDALLSLTKLETIFNRFGKDWMQLVYEPINQASNKELTMKEKACKEFAAIHSMYSLEEWQTMRSVKAYTVGVTERFTREQVICMALNWGNLEGRRRVLSTINKNVKHEYQLVKEYDVQQIFESALTQKDWDFIERVWEQIGQYWPERNKVQENLYGVGLGKVRALSFTINGRKLTGGYYPIKYDSKLSSRSSDIEADDIIRQQLSGNATMAIGMGSTKSRVAEVKNQQLNLRLDVWPAAVNEAIHHISMREAVTDVYKLINHPEVQRSVEERYGKETFAKIKQWAKDCWKTDVQKQDTVSKMLEQMRRNTSGAVMMFRTTTAALNVLNIFPMMWKIGAPQAVKALVNFGLGFYKGTDTYNTNRDFVMEHSPMMRSRMNTMDRDIQQDMKISVQTNTGLAKEKARSVKDAVNQYGYWFIAETDLMMSMALWKHSYDESMQDQVEAGELDREILERNAVSAADANVRAVYGSGMVKDQAEIQRKNSLIGQLTPFYSYCNTQLNALIAAGYDWKDNGNRMTVFNAVLYWVVLPSIFESLYRSAVAEELDDPDKMLRRLGITAIRNADQGIPVARDAIEGAVSVMLEGYKGNGMAPLAVSGFEEMINAVEAATSDRKDWTDIGRAVSRVSNRYVGFSDTLTDGFWTLVRFSLVDTDRSLMDLMTSIIFDKRYKTVEERQNAEKRKNKKGDNK